MSRRKFPNSHGENKAVDVLDRKLTLLVLLDLSRFNLELFSVKLEFIGFSNAAVSWFSFKSYFLKLLIPLRIPAFRDSKPV